jgi:hypothetical protein
MNSSEQFRVTPERWVAATTNIRYGGRTMAISNQIAEADFYITDLISPLTETVPA